MASVLDILKILDGIAPFDLAEDWDNAGLLAGKPDSQVNTVLCALDLNREVIQRAQEIGAQLIVTHHPILFRGRKNLREDDPEGALLCELIRADLSLIAVHTNFDTIHPGVNDALAAKLSLRDVETFPNGLCVGNLESTETLNAFAEHVEASLQDAVRVYGNADRPVRRIAVMGGSGADYAKYAIEAGADAFVTGEIGYHRALDARDKGLAVLEAGHAATEKPAIFMLAGTLQKALNAVQYRIHVDFMSDM